MARPANARLLHHLGVLPARAGMARPLKASRIRSISSPRTRGDGPAKRVGWFGNEGVLPARAGMARAAWFAALDLTGVLPARAGMARVSCHSQ